MVFRNDKEMTYINSCEILVRYLNAHVHSNRLGWFPSLDTRSIPYGDTTAEIPLMLNF